MAGVSNCGGTCDGDGLIFEAGEGVTPITPRASVQKNKISDVCGGV